MGLPSLSKQCRQNINGEESCFFLEQYEQWFLRDSGESQTNPSDLHERTILPSARSRLATTQTPAESVAFAERQTFALTLSPEEEQQEEEELELELNRRLICRSLVRLLWSFSFVENSTMEIGNLAMTSTNGMVNL